ncbi:MAG: IS1 family transposase [Terriglobia bacterium]|jgi:IS1 family transposase
MVSINRLPNQKRAEVIRCIVEGNSIRSTVRITGVAKNTIARLLLEVGNLCASYEDRELRNIKSKHIQCDEIWSFVYARQKNVTPEISEKHQAGDIWTWTAIDADTKLAVSWMLGGRDGITAKHFIEDLAGRLASRVQLTTDGLKVYLNAVEDAFGADIDYAMLHKIYANTQEETRYSPAECIGCERKRMMGNPDPDHISTSYVERSNLSMRMQMRRFTRLTNAFCKKMANHGASVALYFMYYNWVRVHQTLRVTPAMEAGLTDHLWSIEEMLKNISN